MLNLRHLSSWIPTQLTTLPCSASQTSHTATFFGGITLATLCYGSPLTALASGLTALASYGISKAKEVQEQQALDKKLSEQFTHKFLEFLRRCVNHPANRVSETNPTGYTEQNIQRMREVIDILEAHYHCKGNHDPENHKSLRESFVGLQGASEHLMAILKILEELSSVEAVFHTKFPITPLCTPISEQELAALKDIPATADEIATVRKRAFTIRQLLSQKEGVKAYVEYPQGGKSQRKPGEVEEYDESCRQFKGTLVDHELPDLKDIEQSKIGATYVLKTSTGQYIVISIKISQITDVQQSGPVALYIGPYEAPAIQERVNDISDYLVPVGGTDIRKFAQTR